MKTKDGAKPPAKKKGGMPAYVPTKESRGMVLALITAGVTWERTADVLGINKSTLQKYYRDELQSGREKALGRNTIALMNMAAKGNATAAIYLQKCLGGAAWREKQETEHSGDVKITVHYGSKD